jgi:hypothetical protein
MQFIGIGAKYRNAVGDALRDLKDVWYVGPYFYPMPPAISSKYD